MSIYGAGSGRRRAVVATVDTMVSGHEWAGGVAHSVRDAEDDDTVVNATLHGLGLAPDRAARTGARPMPFQLCAPPRAGDPARGGRHAKPSAGANWARDRALPMLRENRRAAVATGVVLMLIVIGAATAGRGGAATRPCGQFYPGKQDSDVCADAGGTASLDDFTVSATPLALIDNGAGHLSLCTSVSVTNDSGDDRDNIAVDFKIQDPGGEMIPATSGTLRTAGTLAAGDTETGTVCDDRSVHTGVYALIYEPSVLGARRGVWLSQL